MTAQKKTLNEKIDALRISRMAWAEVDDARSEMAVYQSALRNIDADGKGASAFPKITSWLDMTGGKRMGRA